jgi:hypothetical protein
MFDKERMASLRQLLDSGDRKALLKLYRGERKHELSGCEQHTKQVFRYLGLEWPANLETACRRLTVLAAAQHSVEELHKHPTLRHWFRDGREEESEAPLTLSVQHEKERYSLDSDDIPDGRVQTLLQKFLHIPAGNWQQSEYAFGQGGLKEWFEESNGGESVKSIAISEAWIYEFHGAKTGRGITELSLLQHGVVQQALRMSMILYLATVCFRKDRRWELTPFPCAARRPVCSNGEVMERFEASSVHYDCTGPELNDIAGLEVHVFPSSDTEQSMSVVTRAQGHKKGKEFEEDCQREDPQFSRTAGTYPSRTIHRAINKFKQDELNAGTGSVLACKPSCPRLYHLGRKNGFGLRYQFMFVAEHKSKGSLEREVLGTRSDVLGHLRHLTTTEVGASGEPSEVPRRSRWGPTTSMPPFSQLGTALLGVYGWDDPGVQRELEILLTGPLEQAEALIERDLKRAREQIRESWSAFKAAEERIFKEGSGVRALAAEIAQQGVTGVENLQW